MNLIDTAIKAALEAGTLLKKGFGTTFKIGQKEGKQNLVTEYDLLSQKLIIEIITSVFPTHQFLAEEENVKDIPSDDVLWIIDPLDGTVNFAHDIPIFAVSIAAMQKDELLAGVIYHPMQDELFVAEKGSGAFLDDKKISVNSQKELEYSFTATGFPYNASENPNRCIDRFVDMVRKGIPIRRLGSAAIDMAYVAAGRFHLFWEVGLHAWDLAAGKLLIEEAGGRVTHYDGAEHGIFGYSTVLATNGFLHPPMVELLKEDMQ